MERERELVKALKEKREIVASLKAELRQKTEEMNAVEQELLSLLTAEDKEATAKYEGIGWASRVKPRVYANVTEDHKPEFFAWLKQNNLDMLIKPNVPPATISALVKDFLAEGKELPKFINYYLKESIRVY